MARTQTTTKTKTSTKPAKDLSNDNLEQNAENATENTEEVDKTIEDKKRVFNDEDWILCKSSTQGKLVVYGRRTGTPYTWYGYGEIIPVQYNDLKALKLSRAKAVYYPRIIVQDYELLETKEWNDIKKIYDKAYAIDDVEEILSLNVNEFKELLETAPVGVKNTIKSIVADRYTKGTFDSVQKIKLVEEYCDAEILNLL